MGITRGRRSPETRQYFLTVAEVMAIFRVGRTTAYALAHEYIDTGGSSGIPCEKVGGLLRFPTVKIERLIGRSVVFPVASPETCDPNVIGTLLGAPGRRDADRRARRCPPGR